MRGSFGARHLAALCAHRMGALYQVARLDREQRSRPSVTGEIPRSDLVLRQQAARPGAAVLRRNSVRDGSTTSTLTSWALRLLRRWRDTRRLAILAALDSRANVLPAGTRSRCGATVPTRSWLGCVSPSAPF